MTAVIMLSIISFLLAVIAGLLFAKEKNGAGSLSSVMAIGLYALVISIAAPKELGFGIVPQSAEDFTKRLKSGLKYHLVASQKLTSPDGDSQVLLVNKVGTTEFFAIRVKDPVPPEYFTLLDGEPVAIAPTASVVSK